MVSSIFNSHILAIALPSLRTSPLFFTRIATIVLLYAAALYTVYLSVVYIQSIGSFASSMQNFCIFDAKLLFFYGPTVLKKNRSGIL
jgi:hypothetical protein